MTFSRLWARITGADQGKEFPIQQISMMGRIGDFIIIHPYGLYADLPNDVALQGIAKGRVIPVTTTRPSDTERGEPVFFHPATGARIIARNSGDLELIPAAGKKVLVTGNLEVTGDTTLGATVTSNGTDISDTHTHIGSPTAPTGAQSNTGSPV